MTKHLTILFYIFYLLVTKEKNVQEKQDVGCFTKNYPSIFQAWNGIENRHDENELTRLARHELAFGHPYGLLKISWRLTPDQLYEGLATELEPHQENAARQRKVELLSLNPNLLLLVELRYRDAKYLSEENERRLTNPWAAGFYPPDSPYWLRDSTGEPLIGWGEDTNSNGKIDEDDAILNFLIDFTNTEVQQLIVKKAVALKQSGLFDGIMLDWWNEDAATSPIAANDWSETILTPGSELEARLSLLRKIRGEVGDDFLILVNANQRQIPKSAGYVNGIFMECYKTEYQNGYTLNQIKQIEHTLHWAEQHLKAPRINCLEGWRVVTDYLGDLNIRIAERNSAENRQWMRMITTLSLTHSDGYLLFSDDNAIPTPDHLHNWYSFWDAELGQPIQERAQQYRDASGLFIREFENGWAVYNRSGSPQPVSFDEVVVAVDSEKRQSRHEIPNFDGEIFLKYDADE